MIRIRHAEPGDAGALAVLGRAVGAETGRWILTTEWRDAASERRYLKAVRRSPDAAVLVADDEGEIIGRLSIARDPHPASSHVADLGMMVAATHRRRGVGRALLDGAVAWAGDAGVRKLELHVFPWNEAALRMYEATGFERVGIRHGHYMRAGQEVDAILMERELGGQT